MVQRKVPNKLGIRADHVKSEKRLGSLKPSSCQHQDGKNKGTDLKKKMKKSRSIKLSDIEGLRSSPLRKTISQPGKPPPLDVPAAAATPQKKSVIKAIDGSPNYMKSTSSSEAKKEGSQVSSRNIQTSSDSKSLRRRSSVGSKTSSGSYNKPARTLTRTSSLKLVRTLTKSPSFKPARALAKKCSRVALCTDMDVQRATCSSTLKDSKFPAYLTLNPGGTESEGTSIIKVCPYTYCSLNGHHHTPLPPLKRFLKARRRSLKTQRSMKMEALSPRRLTPCADGTEEFNEEQVVYAKELASSEVDLGKALMSPLMQGGSMDFFIEIYAKSKGNDVDATGGSTQKYANGMDGSGCGNETAPEHDTDKPVSEGLSEGSPHSEIDFAENLEHCGEIISTADISKTLYEELKNSSADEEFRGILVKEESSPWNFNDGDKQEGVSSFDGDHTRFDVIDMEWEEWQLFASEPGDEAYSAMESDNESDLNIGDSSESHGNNLHDEFVITSDESGSNYVEKIPAERAEQVFEEDAACIDSCSQLSDTLCYYQVSSTEEMFGVLIAMEQEEEEENTETDLIGTVTTSSSREELYEEPMSGKQKMLENGVSGTVNEVSEADPLLEVPENSCSTDLKDEAFESTEQFQLHSCDKLEQDETNEDYNVIGKPGDSEADQTAIISDFCLEKELPSSEAGKVAGTELLIGIHVSTHVLPRAGEDDDNQVEDNQNNQLSEVNNAIDESFSTQDTFDESLIAESQDYLSDGQHENTHVDNQSVLEEDQDEIKFKLSTSMDSDEQNSSRMHKTSLADGSEEVGKMELEDIATPALDVADTFPAASDKTSHKPRNKLSFSRSNTKEEVPDNHNNIKWTIGRKGHEESNEEPRKFNPRGPNFLDVAPEPDAEKVDLRHQMMDERKNAEEWMLDHALQQAVTKLAPARKRKVALLVEAFETVLPITKCETRLRNNSTGFAHGRPAQACN